MLSHTERRAALGIAAVELVDAKLTVGLPVGSTEEHVGAGAFAVHAGRHIGRYSFVPQNRSHLQPFVEISAGRTHDDDPNFVVTEGLAQLETVALSDFPSEEKAVRQAVVIEEAAVSCFG